MSIQIFNIKNHRTDGDALRHINEFSTNDFCGIFGSLPVGASAFIKNGNSIGVNNALLTADEFYLIGGGCLLSINKSDVANKTANGTYAVRVLFSNEDNFESDSSTSVSIISNANVSNYDGKTLWISGGFIIPLFSISGGTCTSLAVVKNGKSWEEFLTQSAIDNLKANLNSEYTHQVGSTGNNKFGKVANYDFSADSIRHFTGTNTPTEILTTNSSNKFTLPTYDSGALYVENHNVNSGLLPITAGGTGADSTLMAKQNLGIYYGADLPSQHDFGGATINQGDIYFRMLE